MKNGNKIIKQQVMYKIFIIGRYLSSSNIRYDIKVQFFDSNGNEDTTTKHTLHWLDKGYNGDFYYINSRHVVTSGSIIRDLHADASYNGFTICQGTSVDKYSTDLGNGAYIATGSLLKYRKGNPAIKLLKNRDNQLQFTADTFNFFKDSFNIIGDVEVILGEMHYTLDDSEPSSNEITNICVDEQILNNILISNVLKIKYFTFRYLNNPNGKVYEVTSSTPDTLDAPSLTYDSSEDCIEINGDYESEVQFSAYSKHDNSIRSRNVDINNKISISDIISTLTTSFQDFVNYFNIHVKAFTDTLESDVATIDLFNTKDRVINIYPVVKIDNNFVTFDIDDCDNESCSAWYTIDGSTPEENGQTSIKYDGIFQITKDVETIKVIYYIGRVSTVVREVQVDYNYNPEIIEYGEPVIPINGCENTIIEQHYINRYIDIICNFEFNIPKVLNSISYVLSQIDSQYNPINVSEEYLNRRFSGNTLAIYTDECYTGLLDIEQKEIINKLDEYKTPYWDKGCWNLNYFRNLITEKVTGQELASYCNIIYYDFKTRTNKTAKVDLNKLKNANLYDASSDTAASSDNRSLIFGKYFIVRLIFKHNVKFKFDEISFNVNKY